MMNPRKINIGQDAHNVWMLLTKGDKTQAQIRKALGLSGNRWKHALSQLLNERKVGTVNGKPPTYTVLNEVMK